MWGKRKSSAPESTFFAWREADLARLARDLRSDRPLLQTTLTGYRQAMTIDGSRYQSGIRRARTDRELYDQSALLFDGAPSGEDAVTMFEVENQVAGVLSRRVRVKGTFAAAHDAEALKVDGKIGRAFITAYDADEEGTETPVLEFHFAVADVGSETRLQSALRNTLGGHTASCNLRVDPVEDVDAWIASFKAEGYSPDLTIRRVFVTVEAGKGNFFD